MSKKEPGKETQKIESARDVDSRDGLLGQEKITAVEKFAKCLLNVPYIWLPYKTSDYAIQKPVRILLKTYRILRNLPSEERRFQMVSELRQVFLNPPTGIIFKPEYSEVENKSFEVTDEFLSLLGLLYADIPSLISRNENRLIHAVELALQRNLPQARIESRKIRADKINQKISKLIRQIDSTKKDNELTGDEKNNKLNELRDELESEKQEFEKNLKYLKGNIDEEEIKRIEERFKEIIKGGTI